jgi:hypothetical protein
MKPHGTYKLRYHARRTSCAAPTVCATQAARDAATDLSGASGVDGFLARLERDENRVRRIVASLREDILGAGDSTNLRIRRVFRRPREIYRLELALPDLGYQRITLLDRETLEELLEADDVREVVEGAALGS